MFQIARQPRVAIYNRISDATLGYNAQVTAIASNYTNVDTSLLLIGSWALGGANFLFGRVNPDALDQSSDFTYPVCSIDIGPVEPDQGLVLSAVYSGRIPVVIDLHLSWPEASAIPNFAEFCDCAEAAMFMSINNVSNLNYGSGMAYNGKLALSRSPIALAGSGWRRTLTFVAPFTVIAS